MERIGKRHKAAGEGVGVGHKLVGEGVGGGEQELVRSWASEIDAKTLQQALTAARCKATSGPVALMPDAHLGIGATVGSVIPTAGAIIPAAVGVDLGCGVIAVRTDLSAADLPDSLDPLLGEVAKVIPAGFAAHRSTTKAADRWLANDPLPDAAGIDRKALAKVGPQLGTLGGGNHFVEVSLDEADRVWCVLHSGSRGIGNRLATGHIDGARRLCADLQRALEDRDLAYYLETDPDFDRYVTHMLWAQRYAYANREIMMDALLGALAGAVGRVVARSGERAAGAGDGQSVRRSGGRPGVRVDDSSSDEADDRADGRRGARSADRTTERIGGRVAGRAGDRIADPTDSRISDRPGVGLGDRAVGKSGGRARDRAADRSGGRGGERTLATVERINCHHNYAVHETHGGRRVWITRKGAIRARAGDRGVIPGSMGAETYVVTGLGNPDSYESAAHGAGRRMSRRQAKRQIPLGDFRAAMAGRTWQQDRAERLLDESPMAYKDITTVMADQADLVQVDHVLRAVLNYKGC